MDVNQIAQQATALLAPVLPYLLTKARDTAVQEAIKKVGKKAWEHANNLWHALRPKVEASPAALEAAQDVATHPDDADSQAALRVQLRKILSEDPELAGEVARLLDVAKADGVAISVGNRSFSNVGGITGSTIITGDHNKVTK